MARRRRPHHPLGTVKAAFADASRLNRTMTAADGADDLGMDEQAVVEVIAGLTASDFEKSMPSASTLRSGRMSTNQSSAGGSCM
jgi:motility quorum-sensing regulator/GCU-specific mRNA interferase toxin